MAGAVGCGRLLRDGGATAGIGALAWTAASCCAKSWGRTTFATYSERLAGSVVQTPREQAAGELRSQGGQDDVTGQPKSVTVVPETAQPFNPSEDPTNIQTLPTVEGQGAQSR